MNRPFLCKPYGKDYLWGGRRLQEELAKEVDVSPLAETWECSTHPDGISTVASGDYQGEKLSEVLKLHPEYLGKHVEKRDDEWLGELPILVKFIDAKQDLSIQVHPTDEYARKFEFERHGKTEFWYVLEATKNASIIYGLKYGVEKKVFRKAVEEGTLENYLQRISIKKDQVFLVEAGTIHAIGAGCLIAEIQENSNLTYRLYDYGRIDKNGKKRKLDIDKGLEVMNPDIKNPKQPLRVLRYKPGCAKELLCRCRYFEVYRMLVNTERKQVVLYKADELSFRVLLCIEGCGVMFFDNTTLEIYKGDCVFVPADSVDIRIHGKLQFLDINC